MGRSLKICHLYPDILNLYGDRGNTITLRRRCEWRGIEAEMIDLPLGADTDFSAVDIFFMGGGQDFDQFTLLADLGIGQAGSKAARLTQAIEAGAVVLSICGGYQLLGTHYVGRDGKDWEFIGAMPCFTDSASFRMIGNLVYECEDFGTRVVGFENHSGCTHLPAGDERIRPLGRTLVGYGNNTSRESEGARYLNAFGTYSHGPLLPKNPAFADGLLRLALERKYGDGTELQPLDDRLETLAHNTMLARLTH